MSCIGFDIGGTKIGAGIFTEEGELLAQTQIATPDSYDLFLDRCVQCIEQLERQTATHDNSIGIGITGLIDQKKGTVAATNMPFLHDKTFRDDFSARTGRAVRMANDANCAALAEARTGAGKGYDLVFGLIMGTGVGGALVYKGQLIEGANGMAGEIGHLPMPYRLIEKEESLCACGQPNCVEKSINGAAVADMYFSLTRQQADAREIADRARRGEADALNVLDRYYDRVAKAMVIILHAYDPDIIVVSGGLSSLPSLCETVQKRWGKYAMKADLQTRFTPALHGPMAGMRGAAFLAL